MAIASTTNSDTGGNLDNANNSHELLMVSHRLGHSMDSLYEDDGSMVDGSDSVAVSELVLYLDNSTDRYLDRCLEEHGDTFLLMIAGLSDNRILRGVRHHRLVVESNRIHVWTPSKV